MSIKISVVVPTYAPGDRIDRLVRSIESQTMPAKDFEVIFVDDGSPDDTWPRLERIRDSHGNVRIERIKNSGWPSRPRNVGLELARGEYVLFMDHDDELYPDGLRAGYAMAARTGADVLNGKESRTDQPKWALEIYDANADNVVDRQDIHPLIPTNPHKLFRRELLMQHDIRFPEGRRVLWEDVFFALDVAAHASVVSVLADTPFYHWVRGQVTASSSYTRDRAEYWRWVREIVVQTNEKLGGDDRLAGQWRLMMLHQYRSRVLSQLGAGLFRGRPEDLALAREVVEDLLDHHIPAELDAALTPTQLGRATLVRSRRWDLLEKLSEVDAELIGVAHATSVHWEGDGLHITSESRWASRAGSPLAVRFDGDRVVRALPPDVAAALPDDALDMTTAFALGHAAVGVRSRETAVTWLLLGTSTSRVDDVEGRPDFVVTAEAVLDPATAGFGHFLEDPSWDVSVRNTFLGAINQRGLRSTVASRTAVRRGRVLIAYSNRHGMLSIDLDETNRSLAGSAKFIPDRARVTPLEPPSADGQRQAARRPSTTAPSWADRVARLRRSRRLGRFSDAGLLIRAERLAHKADAGPADLRERLGPPGRPVSVSFEVPFKTVHSVDGTILTGRTQVGDAAPRPARISGRGTTLWLESELEAPPGVYPLLLLFNGREVDSGLEVVVAKRSATLRYPAVP